MVTVHEIGKMFRGNRNGVRITTEEVIKITYKGDNFEPVVDIYAGSKYAEWHGEFVQTAPTNPDLKPLFDRLSEEGYEMNVD